MPLLTRRVGGRHARRLISLLVLASLLAAHLPIPISVPHSGKDGSARFPCENSPCGCQTAEQCWRGCCCCTNAEKLAWARENGVTPPAHVVTAARQEAAAESHRTCRHDQAEDDSHQSELSHAACCEARKPVAPTAADDAGKTKFVIGIAAQRCQGNSSHWQCLPWMVAFGDEPSRPDELIVPLILPWGCIPLDVTDSPPTPPPRPALCVASRA